MFYAVGGHGDAVREHVARNRLPVLVLNIDRQLGMKIGPDGKRLNTTRGSFILFQCFSKMERNLSLVIIQPIPMVLATQVKITTFFRFEDTSLT